MTGPKSRAEVAATVAWHGRTGAAAERAVPSHLLGGERAVRRLRRPLQHSSSLIHAQLEPLTTDGGGAGGPDPRGGILRRGANASKWKAEWCLPWCLPTSAREDTHSAAFDRIQLHSLRVCRSHSHGALPTLHNTVSHPDVGVKCRCESTGRICPTAAWCQTTQACDQRRELKAWLARWTAAKRLPLSQPLGVNTGKRPRRAVGGFCAERAVGARRGGFGPPLWDRVAGPDRLACPRALVRREPRPRECEMP